MSRLLLAAVVMAVTAAGSASAASATRPLLTYALAPVVYDIGVNVGFGVCATDLRGNPFRLSDPHLDHAPTWSRDGRTVAYVRGTPGGGYDVVATDARGRNLRILMHYEGNVQPSLGGWSRDSRRLAISTYGSAPGIYILNADGTAGHAILAAGYQAYLSAPSWSRDGRRLLFSIQGDPSGHPGGTYVVNPDGSNLRLLVNSAFGPSWSPDGRRFSYFAYAQPGPHGSQMAVWVARRDGTHHQIALPEAKGLSWSPNSRRLAYTNSQNELGVVAWNGTGPRVLAHEAASGPAWSPDGRLIAYVRDGTVLATIRPDGTRERTVYTDGLPVEAPVWRPAMRLPSGRRPCMVHGTPRADVISGTNRGDLTDAGDGNDRIYGRGGEDLLIGGAGRDRVYGGPGDDVFLAQDGLRDVLYGGPGTDTAFVDPGVDRVTSIEVVH